MPRSKYAISKTKGIDKLLKKKVSEILEITARDVVAKIKEYIQRYWYDVYTPQDYERTNSLLRSVKADIGRSKIEIYIDETEFEYALRNSLWNQHISFDGEDFGEGLIQFIDQGKYDSGKVGSLKNPKVGKGSNFIKKINIWLKTYVDNEISKRVKNINFK